MRTIPTHPPGHPQPGDRSDLGQQRISTVSTAPTTTTTASLP